MSQRRPPRLFTLEEANALLPTLRGHLHDLKKAREDLAEVQQQLARRHHGGPRSNGHVQPGGELDRLTAAAEDAQQQVGAAVRAIAHLGCELKDPDRGMVDFRTEREGRVVYWCWLAHEPRVMYWHELDAGYLGRTKIQE